MQVRIISFTDRGQQLAELLADRLCGTATRCGRDCSLAEWVRDAFDSADALIYVGAVGICVRTIAPYIKSKTRDPAVVVIDETGRYVIPVLSGHLGGAQYSFDYQLSSENELLFWVDGTQTSLNSARRCLGQYCL